MTGLACPTWCRQSGSHRPDFEDGTRIHSAPVGRWLTVIHVDTPGRADRPTIAVNDDVELTSEQVHDLIVDLTAAREQLAEAAQ